MCHFENNFILYFSNHFYFALSKAKRMRGVGGCVAVQSLRSAPQSQALQESTTSMKLSLIPDTDPALSSCTVDTFLFWFLLHRVIVDCLQTLFLADRKLCEGRATSPHPCTCLPSVFSPLCCLPREHCAVQRRHLTLRGFMNDKNTFPGHHDSSFCAFSNIWVQDFETTGTLKLDRRSLTVLLFTWRIISRMPRDECLQRRCWPRAHGGPCFSSLCLGTAELRDSAWCLVVCRHGPFFINGSCIYSILVYFVVYKCELLFKIYHQIRNIMLI